MRFVKILAAVLLGAVLGAAGGFFGVRELLWAQHVAQYGEHAGEFWGDLIALLFAAPAGALLGGGTGAFLQIRRARRERREGEQEPLDRRDR